MTHGIQEVTSLPALRFLPNRAVDGVVAINAVHLNEISAFNHDALLWSERQIRSVANMTRQDARDILAVAHQFRIRPQVTYMPLEHANEALMAVKEGR